MTAEEVIDAWIDPCGSDTGAGILNALQAARYAVIQLPEVDDTDSDGCVWFSESSDPGTVGAYPGHHVVWGVWEWTPDQARAVAAQWLAAADAAEDQ